MPDLPSSPHRVVIAGGGVAGLEAMLALTAMAGPRVEVTLVSPDPSFRLRALSVRQPFAQPGSRAWSLASACEAHGARFVQAAVLSVDTRERVIRLSGGSRLEYDALFAATGAVADAPFTGGLLFRGPQDVEAVHGLVQDVEGGWSTHVAFVVPGGTTWPLPLYELALMLAERASSLCLDDLSLTIFTPEPSPLAVFGGEASAAVADRLAAAGIDVRPATTVTGVAGRRVLDGAGQVLDEAQRVVVLGRLRGRALPGLPWDDEGFVPIDDHGRVTGADGVWAAGDGTTCPIKQGGVAAQLAEVAAADIARAAGADQPDRIFDPVLRAELLTGADSLFLRSGTGPERPEDASLTAGHPLWWPPAKVVAPHVAAWLAHAELHDDPAERDVRVVHAEGDPLGGIELLR
ncbi:FAD-dependent oxidoreductase [Conexibacter sp. SYSU D00693]|uniref:FAD-dependent oxidoreductase n=1 Tax=Conexibacter sp. SYSU D00693 TaxID=2812560 RepID=UPI00196B384D|nr:FAD-dependent oxidoreductase [Conexibacter sp. SYSU D00693]